MKKFFQYINPISHLGDTHYSIVIPFMTTLLMIAFLEFLAYGVFRDPLSINLAAIFVFIALIVYFAFRHGIRGGLITALLTVAYYLYIIATRNYQGDQLRSGLETTTILGIVYGIVAWVIGWLKQTIDALIEREANEKQRLSAILQQLPVGVIITDSKGIIDQANNRADKILGKKIPIGFKVGKTFFVNVVESKPLPPSRSILETVLTTGKTLVNEEFTIKTNKGNKVFIKASASPIRNIQGNIIAAAEILTDITSQKEIEIRKDDFVNMASHELKTPITSLKLYAETLKKRIRSHEDPTVLRSISGIHDQTLRLQNLVSDLLDVSRLQTGKLVFTKEQFLLDELINEVVKELTGTIKKRKILFESKSSPRISGDKFRIYQVLTNLITNAGKYSPDGSKITIQLKKTGKFAEVSVKDEGIGIPKDQQKKIFDRLYQVTESKEKVFPGLGMGLYIVKEIIKKHKGEIWVESTVGKGSTFYFRLPLH